MRFVDCLLRQASRWMVAARLGFRRGDAWDLVRAKDATVCRQYSSCGTGSTADQAKWMQNSGDCAWTMMF